MEEMSVTEHRSISVVICAYTEDRWDELSAAVDSIKAQEISAREIVVVVDHNPGLFRKVQEHVSHVVATENQYERGLSGARNAGVLISRGDIVAFLDDDAVAAPDWLARFLDGYADPQVMGVGGVIEPLWCLGRPRWFPDEFDWVVGCTYRGMPESASPVRNLIGTNMSFRREVFETVGAFRSDIGRTDKRAMGCEETELCIRAHQRWPQRVLLYEPRARVRHRVPATRASWPYFRARCYAEGLSKARVAQYVGAKDGLSSERGYTFQTLPHGVARDLAQTVRGDLAGFGRAGAIVAGLAMTSAGYLIGTTSGQLSLRWHSARMARRSNHYSVTDPLDSSQSFATQAAAPAPRDFKPVRVLELEIGHPLSAIQPCQDSDGHAYERAMALVRLHTRPLGVLELPIEPDGLGADDIAREVWRAFQAEICAHMRQDGSAEPDSLGAAGLPSTKASMCVRERDTVLAGAPFASVIVATHDRPVKLATCLRSLLSLDYPHFEIIVVDNAPSSRATADFISQVYGDEAKIRYVREDRPGLGCAHNRGLREVQGEIVAFTDDDVVVDRHWLAEIATAFTIAGNVGCVTGMISPMELETPAQIWIEQYGGFGKGCVRRIFDLGAHRSKSSLYPYAAGAFGSGANMAFRASALRAIGGFDPALGAGSPGVGGDDLAAFFQIITKGFTLVYEPGAIVHHAHRREYAGLQRQVYGYGVGLTAYLTKCVLDNPAILLDVTPKIPRGLLYALSSRSPKNSRKLPSYPRELTTLERKGMLYGPIAYFRGRRQARGIGQQHAEPLASPASLSSPSALPVEELTEV
jgi:GT2 family glycosyltransferase